MVRFKAPRVGDLNLLPNLYMSVTRIRGNGRLWRLPYRSSLKLMMNKFQVSAQISLSFILLLLLEFLLFIFLILLLEMSDGYRIRKWMMRLWGYWVESDEDEGDEEWILLKMRVKRMKVTDEYWRMITEWYVMIRFQDEKLLERPMSTD